MELNRRQFVALAAAVAATAAQAWAQGLASASTQPSSPDTQPDESAFDAGPLSDFQSEKVYEQFRERGLFVIHRDKRLFVLSSVCTHKGCKVRAQADQSFLCKCHGSRFDPEGKVTKGPAARDLPQLPVAEGADGHLLIRQLSFSSQANE